jgi:23S rRNA (cytosine1962-C5)-methyltransferase
MTVVQLAKGHDRRVQSGHPWVFSNEIDGDVSSLPRGGLVEVQDAAGRFVGRGFSHPAALVAVRLLTRRSDEDPDSVDFFEDRLRRALALRQATLPGRTSYRLVHGEGDALGGLVVDRYADVVVAQLNTAGMDRRRDAIAEALRRVVGPRAGLLRNDGSARALEGLPQQVEDWFGDAPDDVDIEEGPVRLRVAVRSGQKTGHFFDHAANRAFFARLCRGLDVLDVFAHTGAWALGALVAGARSALAIDRSEVALAAARVNAGLNGVDLRTRAGDAVDLLRALRDEGRLFDALVLDPPAFARSRRVAIPALRGYRRLHADALRLLRPGGLLATASCSHPIEEGRFLEAVVQGAADAGRTLRIVWRGGSAPDHPVLPAVPETAYLKFFVAVVDAA